MLSWWKGQWEVKREYFRCVEKLYSVKYVSFLKAHCSLKHKGTIIKTYLIKKKHWTKINRKPVLDASYAVPLASIRWHWCAARNHRLFCCRDLLQWSHKFLLPADHRRRRRSFYTIFRNSNTWKTHLYNHL